LVKTHCMRAYVIDVSKIEELQTLSDKDELQNIFYKANSTIVNGEKVILVRKTKNGSSEKFDEFSTEEDLENYRKRVFRYLH
jgi:GTPase involved in cell partitioning and DNA repair